ncbi:MAG: hypothetical protein NXH73_05890 [Flavobacteriaceae bacterium]|nr:hypothetical protein [Flavobacteriaceae bacterium]
MHYSFSIPIPHSPIYKKALEIFTLSKNISQFLVCDMSGLDEDGKEHPDIYFTGDIVQKSISLFPEIINAEQKTYSEEKQKHAESVEHLTKLLYKNCERLERSVPNGKEFISLLRKEIRRFRKMQHNWALTL